MEAIVEVELREEAKQVVSTNWESSDLVDRSAPFNAVLPVVGSHQHTVAVRVAGDIGCFAKEVEAGIATIIPWCRAVTRTEG